MMSTAYIGIDPGSSGGISVLDQQGILFSHRLSSGTEWDTADFLRGFVLRSNISQYIVAIEKVHSMPGQGVSSMFKFGKAYGFLRGIVIANGLAFEDVTPQAWLKGLQIPKRPKEWTKAQWKKSLQTEAHRLFPQNSKEIGREEADSVLIAEYVKRKFSGTL